VLLDRRRGHGGSTDSAERLKTIECLTPLIAIGLLKSAMPELAPTSALKFTHPGVERARELMRRNFREPLGVAELAGLTPAEYRRQSRA
jgi:hypothetical protein